jgi:hypothetical protein
MARKKKFKELTKEEAMERMDLIYIESPLGFHFAIDNSFLDQEGDFHLVLPTEEVFYTKDLK